MRDAQAPRELLSVLEALEVPHNGSLKEILKAVRKAYGDLAAEILKRYAETRDPTKAVYVRYKVNKRVLAKVLGMLMGRGAGILSGIIGASLMAARADSPEWRYIVVPATTALAGTSMYLAGTRIEKVETKKLARNLLGALAVIAALRKGQRALRRFKRALQNLEDAEALEELSAKALLHLAGMGVQFPGLIRLLVDKETLDRVIREAGWPTKVPFGEEVVTASVLDLERLGGEVHRLLRSSAVTRLKDHPRIPPKLRELLERLRLESEEVPVEIEREELGRIILERIAQKYGWLATAYVSKKLGIGDTDWWTTQALRMYNTLRRFSETLSGMDKISKSEHINLGKVAAVLESGVYVDEVPHAQALERAESALRELRTTRKRPPKTSEH